MAFYVADDSTLKATWKINNCVCISNCYFIGAWKLVVITRLCKFIWFAFFKSTIHYAFNIVLTVLLELVYHLLKVITYILNW
ncbi:hypothetical protein PAPYR_9807 [Paratrimastix pyriformis]|uniref:Uncharacterized protein n=1 Tax=Paratrimastix pyriformis TaxID=342808 RepID=A0ABQ8UA91_9EUKA|nr:hypothetical protein PAPYR_9807 [Paratrimastix pyriformis]